MQETTPFVTALDAAEKLSLDEQETLVEIVHRRTIERRREELAKDVQDADREFASGKCHPASPDELMKEILS
jgi:hypothetical protein